MKLISKRNSVRLWVLVVCLSVSGSHTFSQAPAEPADKENEVLAIAWQQVSGEHRALCYQAFALAKMLLDRDLRNRRFRMRRAIIVDIDETILDTSSYEARNVKERKAYPDGWVEWMQHARGTAVPGAVEFLNYASARGVRVFYVSNRIPAGREGTAQNLNRLGFPAVNDQTLLMRDDPARESKTARRKAIAAKYHVVLLMGDDLNDFAEVFENTKTIAGRIAATDQYKSEFGTHFVVLPNPMYGNWANALYDYNFTLTEQQKAEKRRSWLRD